MDVVTIEPVVWSKWMGWTDTCQHANSIGTCSHYLTELGNATNGYRYEVYVGRVRLLNKVLRPECCRGLSKCPIKKSTIPDTPCRKHLRDVAIQEAHKVWVDYITFLITPRVN